MRIIPSVLVPMLIAAALAATARSAVAQGPAIDARTAYAALLHSHYQVGSEPGSPEARFDRAMARLELHRQGAFSRPGVGGMISGEAYYAGFVRDLEGVFALDSMFQPALEFLPEFLAHQGDREQSPILLAALARYARDSAAPPITHLVLGRGYRTAGSYDSALSAFIAYEEAGGDPGVARLEAARTLAGLGRLDGAAEMYLDGASQPGEPTRLFYRNDLKWVASDEELAPFDSVPAERRADWIKRFFQLRDAEAIRLPGERLREHLRRWDYVHHHFRVPNPGRWSQFVQVYGREIAPCMRGLPDELNLRTLAFDPSRRHDAREEEAVLDHRAVIYMRHGRPSAVMVLNGVASDSLDVLMTEPGLASDSARIDRLLGADVANSVWVYWFSGRPRTFSFGASIPNSRWGGKVLSLSNPPVAVLRSLAQLDPLYGRAARMAVSRAAMPWRPAVPTACMPTFSRLAIQVEEDAVEGAHSDSYTLTFESSLGAVLQAGAVGDPAKGTGRLLLVFAVPTGRLTARQADDGKRYDLRLRLTAVSDSGEVVLALDTLRTLVAPVAPIEGQFVTWLMELPMPAGTYDIRAALMTPDAAAGGFREWEGVRFGTTASAPGLSDMILARESSGLTWQNGGDRVELNPLDAYDEGGNALVYYEGFNLVPGRRYRTTLTLAPSDGDDDDGVTLRFTETAAGTSQHFRRGIGLQQLDDGPHRLTVTLTDLNSGAEARRTREIRIIEK
ncbi:MAG TPA: hypothetical protein VFS94_04655 [Gemmatimonadales bacterium]|nr:hypothetical protein [Gemmatimonadales bacterium]